MDYCRGGGTIGSPVHTSQAAAPFHGPIDTATPQTRVVGLFASLLHADRAEIEHHAVVGIDRDDVPDNVGQMLGSSLSRKRAASLSRRTSVLRSKASGLLICAGDLRLARRSGFYW